MPPTTRLVTAVVTAAVRTKSYDYEEKIDDFHQTYGEGRMKILNDDLGSQVFCSAAEAWPVYPIGANVMVLDMPRTIPHDQILAGGEKGSRGMGAGGSEQKHT